MSEKLEVCQKCNGRGFYRIYPKATIYDRLIGAPYKEPEPIPCEICDPKAEEEAEEKK